MGILKNQTAARLILQTNLDLRILSITSCQINYVKPSGATGHFDAVQDSTDGLGKIYIDFGNTNNFDESGTWTLAADIYFTDGRKGLGEQVAYTVEESL